MLGGPDLLWGAAVPSLLAMITLVTVWRITRRAASAWRTALVVGYVAGHWTLSARDQGATALVRAGQLEEADSSWAYDPRNFDFVAAVSKSIQPVEALDWLPALALLAILPDALACISKLGPAIGWLLRIALCAFLPWRIVYGSKYWPLSLGEGFDFDLGGWSTTEATCWIGGIAAALLLAWQVLRMAASEQESSDASFRTGLACLVTVGSIFSLIAAGSLVYGQHMALLTAVLASCGVGSKLAKANRGLDAAAGPAVILFSTLLAAGHFFAELSLADASMLLIAFVLAAGWLPALARLSTKKRMVSRGILCLACLAIPIVPAVKDLVSQIPDTEVEQAPNPYKTFTR